MSAVKNSSGISIEFTPWTDRGFVIDSLHIYEKIGGELGKGNMELIFRDIPENNSLITDEQGGTIIIKDTKESGISYTIPVFIMGRRYFKNTITLNFVCCEDKKFFMDPISISYPDITNALNTLYPGNKDIRTESDVNNNVEVYQMNETDMDFCTTLAYSYKRNAIFAYSWSGFILKDLVGINSQGKDENNTDLYLLGQGFMENSEPYSLNYNKYLLYEPQDLWEGKNEKPLNLGSIKNYDDYIITGTDYYKLHENRMYNSRIMNSNLYTSFIIVGADMPDYKLGDIVTYQRAEQESKYPFTKFLVYSNELFISQDNSKKVGPHGMKFEWTTKLLGIETGKWGMK